MALFISLLAYVVMSGVVIYLCSCAFKHAYLFMRFSIG